MKEEILKLIHNKPKHFSKLIKTNPELTDWVKTNSLIQSDNFAEMVYSAIHKQSNICNLGNLKKFAGINIGYRGCGVANKCQCVRELVSTKTKQTKQNKSRNEKEQSLNKRRETNFKKYGHINAAQTEYARNKHKEYYQNTDNTTKVQNKYKEIVSTKYNGINPGQTLTAKEKRKQTLLARYNVDQISKIPSVRENLLNRLIAYKSSGKPLEDGYTRFKQTISDVYNFTLLTDVKHYYGIRQKDMYEYQFECNQCKTVITHKFYHSRGLICKVCNPRKLFFVSNEEQQIYNFITNELGISNGVQSDRILINPYELDMVFYENKIAIEYCGLYWHSEVSSGKDKFYHAQKVKLVNEKGFRLITIFSDEWINNPSIVKSKLANIFKKTSTSYYARKLIIKEVPFNDSKQFLNQYHLQKSSASKINYGLYTHDQQLVALMTFSKCRHALNTKAVDGEYELVRYVTNGSSVVGGASKLLNHFTKIHQPTKVISYSDCRWSEGNVYKTLGFIKKGTPSIGYWYVDMYQRRIHRFNFTKNRLVKEGANPTMTEWEIMKELGYDRIWDCGHQKWVFNPHHTRQ